MRWSNVIADTFDIIIWSVQTGKVLDVLTGHAGPISALAFNPTSQILASVSWDKYLMIWDIFEGKAHREPMFCNSDQVAVAYPLLLLPCVVVYLHSYQASLVTQIQSKWKRNMYKWDRWAVDFLGCGNRVCISVCYSFIGKLTKYKAGLPEP